MKDLLQVLGISRQALHQHNFRQMALQIREQLAIEKAQVIRERHPRMGCRAMHLLMGPDKMGRDRCEHLLLSKGFRLKRYRNPLRTTQSQRGYYFPDLIQGLRIRGINKIWQSDITYFITENHDVFYIVFIEDIYSRRILGQAVHAHMRAEANLLCLHRAFQIRKSYPLRGLIHHSDHGGQYIDNEYVLALKSRQIKISMCWQAWQNAYSERINGTIKNDYLKAWRIETLIDLRRALTKAVNAYNYEKPHRHLPDRMSPVQFENYLKRQPLVKHPWQEIYQYEN
jgi:putative transposase